MLLLVISQLRNVYDHYIRPSNVCSQCLTLCVHCMEQDSLAAEIEGTMRKEIQMSDPEVEDQRYHQTLQMPKKLSVLFFFFI